MTSEKDEYKYYYDHYYGGIIIEADTVIITNPEGYRPAKEPFIFMEDDSNRMFLKMDYDRQQKELEEKKE